MRRWLLPLFSLILSACQTMQQEMDRQTDQLLDQTAQSNRAMLQSARSDTRVVQRVGGAWLGAHAVPIQNDATLPDIFHRTDFRFQFGKGNIMTIAEKLTQVTHIPVRVQPDVLMPMTAFMAANGTRITPENAGRTQARAMLPALPSPAAGGVLAAGVSATVAPDDSVEYDMNYLGTLSGYLELLCARAGISWDYHDGMITLRRLMTQTFTLKAIPGASGFDAALGRDSQTQSGAKTSTGGYASTTKVKMDSAYSVWSALEKSIQAIKTPMGRYSISEATGTITVTDTRAAVEEIARLIGHENSVLARQVAMRVEVLSVKITGAQAYGIDWALVFQKAAQLGGWSLSFSSPASLAGTHAGSMGISILSPESGQGGPWAGSKAFFKALSHYGRVRMVTTANALTLNRQPVPVAITQQTGYLAEITPAPAGASGGSGGTPGLTPGTVTTGFMLNLLPTVLESNRILLQFSVGISSLDALDKQTSGSGKNQQSIQTPMISSTDFLQKAAMRPGQTLVIFGYERQFGQYDKRALAKEMPIGLGGSFSGRMNREAVVILVTPVVAEGAI
ncbi:Type IVB pilus formation outer membrane protein,PilN family [Candidatus Glomeribacter gigasporarum BEG34]|uniref:Type IVB pilus formation outer membrane protein,PilN family n=1 Tax=Candidatus Glomeribacter gigasporarum BEG34 TaxID=1070319 RepID=G2J833_9BURK|nr:PilN family type IVB pilus formation outer membrane protein [Candidatus Glomeribacter gigasporarum]CCD28930.1 Type IVB pilus formation outer membrane protein,PilN family [Candidatus Glomeribacter gigasporarum BEG34]